MLIIFFLTGERGMGSYLLLNRECSVEMKVWEEDVTIVQVPKCSKVSILI